MASKRTTGRGTVLFGLLLLLAGAAGAVVLYLLSQQRIDDAVRDLARAPVGCGTTLSFTDTGTFYVYIEHRGSLDTLAGDCATPDEYSRDAGDEPRVTVTLTSADGTEVELDRLVDEVTYSLDDSFAGTATRQVEIESTGDYVVTVESPDGNDFVVAVGRDPDDSASSMRLGAAAAAVAGVVLGLILLLVGIRRGRRARRIATAYTATPVRPTSPPLAASPPAMPPPVSQPVSQPAPAPARQGQWAPGPPTGPPIGPPERSLPTEPASEPFAPPRVLAPPGLPTLPAGPSAPTPQVPPVRPVPAAAPPPPAPGEPGRDGETGEVRGDA